MKPLHRIMITALASCMLIATGCKKNVPSGSMTIAMTDAPASYSKVNVDIKEVKVHYADDRNGVNGWVTLSAKTGVVNLLDLRNNVTMILAEGQELPPGKISQVRMILGDQNSVETEGGRFPLKVASAYTSGLKLDVDCEVQSSNHLQMLLDFDAARSVTSKGNGEYELNPVIKVKYIEYN